MRERILSEAYRSVARLLEDVTGKETKNQALILLRLPDVQLQTPARREFADDFEELPTSPG
jgi:hypothetical protein